MWIHSLTLLFPVLWGTLKYLSITIKHVRFLSPLLSRKLSYRTTWIRSFLIKVNVSEISSTLEIIFIFGLTRSISQPWWSLQIKLFTFTLFLIGLMKVYGIRNWDYLVTVKWVCPDQRRRFKVSGRRDLNWICWDLSMYPPAAPWEI